MINLPPALYFILAALLLYFIPQRLRTYFMVLLSVFVLFCIYTLDSSNTFFVSFLGFDLNLLRVDSISKLFALVFCITGMAGFIFGAYEKRIYEFVAASIYIGAALGVVFAADLVSLYLFWELMAIGSAFLVFLGGRSRSIAAGYRYFLVHIIGGLLLLAGVLMYYFQTGSIAFNGFDFKDIGTYLILFSFFINAGGFPFTSWLIDAYPESSPLGGAILSAFTSKTAVYVLIRGFSGWDILLVLGGIMALYSVVYAIMENNVRRVLSYSILNQVGFMLCGIGIGTPLAIAGVVAHAVCCVMYKSLLFMSAGAVIYRTGVQKFTQLGGLIKFMPKTFIFAMIGALTIASFPFTSGYVSKSIVIIVSEKMHLFLPWLVLELASATVFLHAGLKFPYLVFFNKTYKGEKIPSEAPKSMLLGMSVLAFMTFFIGLNPQILYQLLPSSEAVMDLMGHGFSDVYLHHFKHVISKLQLLFFAGVSFFLFLPVMKQRDKILFDIDWVYRFLGRLFYRFFDLFLNGLNRLADRFVIQGLVQRFNIFFVCAPGYFVLFFRSIFGLFGVRLGDQAVILKRIESNTFAIGISGIFVFLVLLGLWFLSFI